MFSTDHLFLVRKSEDFSTSLRGFSTDSEDFSTSLRGFSTGTKAPKTCTKVSWMVLNILRHVLIILGHLY